MNNVTDPGEEDGCPRRDLVKNGGARIRLKLGRWTVLRRAVEYPLRWWSRPKARATAFYGGSSLICQALRFSGLLLATRCIAPQHFGGLATASALLGLVSLIKEFGQNSALLSCPNEEPGHRGLHFLIALIGGGLAAALLAVLVLNLPILGDLRPVLSWLMVLAIADSITQTVQTIANKRFDFHRVAATEISAVSTWLLVTATGCWLAPALLTLVLARTGETLVRASFLFHWYRRELSFRITPSIRQYYWRYARLLGPLGWMQYFSSSLDVMILKAFVSDVELGIYERSQQLLRIPLSLSVNLVDSVAGSFYSRDQSARNLTRRSVWQFSAMIAVGAVVGIVLIQIFLSFLASPILGGDWRHQVGALWPWAIPFCLLRPLVWNFTLLFQSSGRPVALFFTLTAMTLLTLGFGLILVPGLHARGAYAAQGLTYFILLIVLFGWFTTRFQASPEARER